METLNAIAEWLGRYWVPLLVTVAVVAIFGDICLAPLAYRKVALVVLAVIFFMLCAVLVWWALANDRSENYAVLVPLIAGIVCGIIGFVDVIWAWVIW